jgi:hypothetical protein
MLVQRLEEGEEILNRASKAVEGSAENGVDPARLEVKSARCRKVSPVRIGGFEAVPERVVERSGPWVLFRRKSPRQERYPCSGWGRVSRMWVTTWAVAGPVASAQWMRRDGVHSR